jgi:hypothetical protein
MFIENCKLISKRVQIICRELVPLHFPLCVLCPTHHTVAPCHQLCSDAVLSAVDFIGSVIKMPRVNRSLVVDGTATRKGPDTP